MTDGESGGMSVPGRRLGEGRRRRRRRKRWRRGGGGEQHHASWSYVGGAGEEKEGLGHQLGGQELGDPALGLSERVEKVGRLRAEPSPLLSPRSQGSWENTRGAGSI